MPLDRRSARMVRPITASSGPARLLPKSVLRRMVRVARVLHDDALKHGRIDRTHITPHRSPSIARQVTSWWNARRKSRKLAGDADASPEWRGVARKRVDHGRLRTPAFRRSPQRWEARY